MTALSQKVHQSLLADIENTGLPLDQISLVDLCDAKEGIYGVPGKNRRPVQLRFQKIKELSAGSYRRLLTKHDIPFGPATLAAKQQEQAAGLPDQATAEDADEVLVLSDEETFTDDDEDIDIELASAFGGISIKSKSSKMPSPEMTPTKNVMFDSGASSGQSTTNTMPSSTEDHAASSDDSDPALDVLDFRRQWGTQSCPYIILARPSHPEHNSPFDIHSFIGIEYNDYEHQGFHIPRAEFNSSDRRTRLRYKRCMVCVDTRFLCNGLSG
jgi:hypothetical protein